MKRRILSALLAVALAVAGTAVLVSYVRSAEQRALAGEQVVEVLVADGTIPAGTDAAALTGRVRTEQVPAKVQAAGSVSDLDAVAGKVTTVDLLPGEQLTTARFAEPAQFATRSGVDIPEGLQVITVSLEAARALGGQLAPGERVGVVASFTQSEVPREDNPTETEQADASTHMILHKVLVTNVQGEPQPTAETDGARDPAPQAGFLVSLAVDAPSAERIVFAAEHGTVWLTLQPDDASEDGTRVQTRGTILR